MPPPGLVSLVERFERNLDDYRDPHYKETRLRQEFVDPFFELLGWDVANTAGLGEAYKDVVHEDAIKVGGGTKAPDYCFRVGGTRKFFAETKKPSEDIKHNKDHAYQLRRYAWSAKLPISVLTDFEELAVYECKKRPTQRDRASKHRVRYYTFDQYQDKWDDIAGILSKDAVLKGDFDRFVEKELPKRGTAEVDDAFLKDIERWRETLAKDIARRNPKLSQREVNFAVQRTIDRIIFLRICEDRGIESYGRLQALLNGSQAYARLFKLFRDADVRYNSGIFHFEAERGRATSPDELTPGIKIEDKVLQGIIAGLYYPDSPYAFSVLPADILGQVYEQFLGKVIRLTAGHNAKVEYKPEVRKAGGVYYTPTYIVDYIVKNTVGKLLEKAKTPAKAAKLKVLDPACGSGSFLLGAYQFLMDWHLDYYSKHQPEKWKKGRKARIYEGSRGDLRLTVNERKRILLDNIHGVDIDEQAVEVTKLSLLLKVLEDVSGEAGHQWMLFAKERALPDLGSNIKCGNSLIGPDYFDGRLDVDDEERMRVNAFEWEREFPDIFEGKNPGFDAVIGNPPWGATLATEDRIHLAKRYPTVADYESSQYFLAAASAITRHGGRSGMIVPNTLALNVYAASFRKWLVGVLPPALVVDCSSIDVFGDPSVRSMVYVGSSEMPAKRNVLFATAGSTDLKTLDFSTEPLARLSSSETWKRCFSRSTGLAGLIDRLSADCRPLEAYCDVRQGYIPYRTTTLTRRHGAAKAKEIVQTRAWHAGAKRGPEYQKELQGRDVGRYTICWSGTWVRYGEWVSTYLPMSVFSIVSVTASSVT